MNTLDHQSLVNQHKNTWTLPWRAVPFKEQQYTVGKETYLEIKKDMISSGVRQSLLDYSYHSQLITQFSKSTHKRRNERSDNYFIQLLHPHKNISLPIYIQHHLLLFILLPTVFIEIDLHSKGRNILADTKRNTSYDIPWILNTFASQSSSIWLPSSKLIFNRFCWAFREKSVLLSSLI